MRVASSYAVLFALAGCSVINSFDDVKPQAVAGNTGGSGNDTGGKGSSGASGSSNAGGGGAAGQDASAGGGGTTTGGAGGATAGAGGVGGAKGGAGGGSAGIGGARDAGGDAFHPGGPTGAIVAYNVAPAEKKLYVMDPENGKPLSSEAMNRVRAIVNDGAPDPTDHWYIMEEPTAGQMLSAPLTLHVRNLDTATGAWKEIGTVPSVPPPSTKVATFGTASKSFFAYLNDPSPTPSGGAVADLIVWEVTDPTKPALVPIPVGDKHLPTGYSKLGIVAEQSSLNVVMVQTAPCGSNDAGLPACDVAIVHFLVNSGSVTAAGQKSVGKVASSGNVDFVDDPFHNLNIIGFPPLDEPASPTCSQTSRRSGLIAKLSPTDQKVLGQVPIPLEMTRFSGAAFDICDNIAFFTTAIDDVAIFAVPLGTGGVVTKQCDSNTGARMFFEPYTHTLLRVNGVAGTDMQAFTVDATGSAPVLKDKILGQLPATFLWGATGVRSPARPSCQ